VSLGFVSLTSWLLPVLCNRRVPLCGFAVARFDSFSRIHMQSPYQIMKSQRLSDCVSHCLPSNNGASDRT